MKNAISWFEIPVTDFEKAKVFYESILASELMETDAMGMKSAFLPADLENGGIGGCIIKGDGYEPSDKGVQVYLNGGDDLSVVLNRVEPAGGKVVLQKTSIGEHGYMAFFIDSEGNKLGLHSLK